jgi:hypothetical protein
MRKIYKGPYVKIQGKKIPKPLALIIQTRKRMEKDGVPMNRWPSYPAVHNTAWMGKNFKVKK